MGEEGRANNLAEAGLATGVDHGVQTYLGAFAQLDSLKEKRFQETIASPSSPG